MASAEPNVAAMRGQLARILESPGFARNERLSKFLRFVVERHLDGGDQELKEAVLAVEVFGRRPDYNPKQDAIVRAEAGRLRARLDEYYRGEGQKDLIVIGLPKGGYVPVFHVAETILELPTVGGVNRRLNIGLAATGFVVVLLALGWLWTQAKNAPVSIAVLPLENLNHDPASDYLADGLTDELIRNLSMIEGLAPRSRTSSFAFKGKSRSLRDAAKELGADYIVEGSVVRSGQMLRIDAQLVRTKDDFPLWSGRFDREVTDALAIQDEISRSIVNNLRLKLGRGRRRYETSAEAYDLYLRALSLDQRKSIPIFEEAISKDPAFAPAYGGLAAAYAFESGIFRVDQEDELGKMRAAAQKAIQLDPLLAEAHDALAAAYARDGQWKQSEESFRRAIELDPSRSESYDDFAMYLLLPLGRIKEAVQQVEAAEKADPLSPKIHSLTAYVLLSAGRPDEAAGYCAKATDSTECLGRVRLGQGRIDEAVQILAAVSNPRYFGNALGRAGRRKEAEKLAATIATNPFQQTLIFAGLGDKDRTFDALDRMTVQGAVRIGRALALPELALLRGDPRLNALRKKVGLPFPRS